MASCLIECTFDGKWVLQESKKNVLPVEVLVSDLLTGFGDEKSVTVLKKNYTGCRLVVSLPGDDPHNLEQEIHRILRQHWADDEAEKACTCSLQPLSPEEADAVRASRRRLLEAMVGYCHTTGCLRRYILDYFGEQSSQDVRNASEKGPGAEDCGESPTKRPAGREEGLEPQDPAPGPFAASSSSECRQAAGACCSNCEGAFDAVDVTELARAVMRCVQELRGRFGKGMVVDVLRGSKSAKVLDLHLDEVASYHTVDASVAQVKEVVELLAAGDYLAITEGTYPTVGLGPRAREAADDGFSLSMKKVVRKAERVRGVEAGAGRAFGASGTVAASGEADPELFERLRTLRKRLADEAGVPPYIVFSDATLRDMCAKRPATEDEFLDVSGVGATKLARYGEAFLAELAAYGSEG